ncbi:anti-sigma factor [Arthrobacter mobilis]|uniref:Anti-sigma factor n=1 Tax=Arthrobacter mobilis TaxID=2724944 RepID=A0A7X6HBA2_9MICC|nr:anti-sigma factor [Arthrobacter mobilis]NKX53806.1 anti-sigma factor [Arthrobacter mobilis]
METPVSRDSKNARRNSGESAGQEPEFEDNSVLHADQLTADDDAAAPGRPTSPAVKGLLAVVAAIVLAVGGFALVKTLGGGSVEEAVRQAPDVASTSVEAPGGTASVAVSASRDAAVVGFDDLASPGRNGVYQLWKIPADGSAPVSAGMLTQENISGARPVVIEHIGGFKELAVTLEPSGGSESPTPPFAVTIPLQK